MAGLQDQIFAPMRKHWLWIMLGAGIMAITTLVVLAVSPPVYTATAVVGPASSGSDALGAKLSRFAGLASIAGVDLGKGNGIPAYEKFKFMVYSDRLGAYQATRPAFLHTMFDKQWDARTRQWHAPKGLGQSLRSSINPLFGLPTWVPPRGQDVVATYDKALGLTKYSTTEMVKLTYKDRDPDRALNMLRGIIADSDALIRADAAARATSQASYLRRRLQTTTVGDYRDTLIKLLGEQEQTLMLTQSDLPFSAEAIQEPEVDRVPVKHPLLYGMIAGIIGFSFASFVAIVVESRRSARRAHLATDREAAVLLAAAA